MKTLILALCSISLVVGIVATRPKNAQKESDVAVGKPPYGPHAIISVAPMMPPLANGATPPDDAFWRKQREFRRLLGAAHTAGARGDVDGAAALYRQAIKVQDDSLARLDLASMLDGANRKADALREYDALFNDPTVGGSYAKSPTVLGRYAALCEAAGRKNDATALYQRIVDAWQPAYGGDLPLPSKEVYDLASVKALATILRGFESMQDNPRATLARYEEAAKIRPTYGLIHLYIAYMRDQLQLPGVPEAYAKAVRYGDPETRAAAAKMYEHLIMGPIRWKKQLAEQAAEEANPTPPPKPFSPQSLALYKKYKAQTDAARKHP